MIDSIVEGISTALNKEFGDGYRIYADNIEQGFASPCFFVSCVNRTNKLFFGRRYFRENRFCIRYFPKDKSREKEECSEAAKRLFLCLELLTAKGDLIRGTKMKSEIVDGALNFCVNYDMFVYLQGEKTPVMEELTTDVTARE